MKRPGFASFGFALLLLAGIAPSSAANPIDSSSSQKSKTLQGLVIINRKSLTAWPLANFRSTSDANQAGLWLFATKYQNAVRVISYLTEGGLSRTELCSGALLDARHVVTAAHCVCGTSPPWQASNYRTCKALLSHVRTDILVPGRGLYSSAGIAAVYSGYNYPPNDHEGRSRPKLGGDIAVLTLSRAVSGMTPLSIGRFSDSDALYAASFGGFSFLRPIPNRDYPANKPFTPGAEQVARLAMVSGDPKDCEDAPEDVFCAVNTALVARSARLVGSGACGGDSGGPVFSQSSAGSKLVGLTSAIDPPTGTSSCTNQLYSSQETFYTRLDKYGDWLHSIQDGDALAASKGSKMHCGEVIAEPFPQRFQLALDVPASVTITPFDADVQLSDLNYSVSDIAAKTCTTDRQNAFIQCNLGAQDKPTVFLGSGYAQIVACWTESQ